MSGILRFVSLGFVLGLAACAEPAQVGAMIAPVTADTLVSPKSPLVNAVQIGDVTGGGATNGLGASNVSAADFRAALTQSLQLETMITTGAPKYTLDANLQTLDKPMAGLDMTVTATVHYTLKKEPEKTAAWDEVVTTPFTADFSSAFVGTDRLRLAEEGAMRENIKTSIGKMIKAVGVRATP